MHVGDNHDFIETNSIPYQYKWQVDIYAQLQISNTREMVVDETRCTNIMINGLKDAPKTCFVKGTHIIACKLALFGAKEQIDKKNWLLCNDTVSCNMARDT